MNTPELEILARLMELTDQKDTALLSTICAAGLKAVREANYRVPMALKFAVEDHAEAAIPRFNEPIKPVRYTSKK